MNKRRRVLIQKTIIYILILLVLYIIQTDPHLLYIEEIKPLLVLPYAVCVAMMDGELWGGLFGLGAGLLCDTSTQILFGFNSLIYMICCVAVGLLVIYFMQPSLTNSLLFIGVTLSVRLLLEYFFYYVMWNYENSQLILINRMLPVLLYTLAVTPLIYWFVKRMHHHYEEKLED